MSFAVETPESSDEICGTYTYLPARPAPNRANMDYGVRKHAFMATASGSNFLEQRDQ